MIKTYLTHKRSPSQAFKIDKKPKQTQPKIKKKKITEKSKSKTISLVEKSSKKADSKTIVVQKLNQCDVDKNDKKFFAFGKGATHKQWNIEMDKISQVQDSCSRRQLTSHRSQMAYTDKQNQNISNLDLKISNLRKKDKNQHKHTQKSKKSNKSKNQKSAISLSRLKQNSHRSIQGRTQKMQKSLKMLWQCVGQLWQNTRVSQYRSEKNGQKIQMVKRCVEQHNEKILQIKNMLSKNEKVPQNLRY